MLTAGLIVGVAVAFSYSFLGDDVESAKAVTVASEKNTEKETALVNENSYARKAPPPPISSNKSKYGSNTTPQAHGHEDHHDDEQKNAPPPPTGAN